MSRLTTYDNNDVFEPSSNRAPLLLSISAVILIAMLSALFYMG